MIYEVTTSGAGVIYENIGNFAVELRDRMIKKAVRDALIPVRDDAKSFVQDQTGTLKGSITVVVKSRGSKGVEIYGVCGPQTKIRVSVRIVAKGRHKGKLLIAIPTRYAHLVEFGHNVVVKGKVVGHVGPKPFMRKAWTTSGGDVAFRVLETSLTEQIESWLAKPSP